MVVLIVGHRGVGKTSLLSRIYEYGTSGGQALAVFDLDAEIEKGEGKTIAEIFSTDGERQFRSIEQDYLISLTEKYRHSTHPVYIAVGAGFNGVIPDFVEVMWLKRDTDQDGRIFLDRPRLKPAISAWEEANELIAHRNKIYPSQSHWSYVMPEGIEIAHYRENLLFSDQLEYVEGILTLLPSYFRSIEKTKALIERRLKWGFTYLEVRDDLLSETQLKWVFDHVPSQHILFSVRKNANSPLLKTAIEKNMAWDWPLELGSCPHGDPTILSLHKRQMDKPMSDCIQQLQSQAPKTSLLKLAVQVNTYADLMDGHKWAHSNLDRFSFLPMSSTGRWRWYRLLNRGQYKINFIREGDSPYVDQPYLLEWFATTPRLFHFGAVLGSPVHHSRSPIEHEVFFAERGLAMFPIDVTVEDVKGGALQFLRELGLCRAAVTSPLKESVFNECKKLSEDAKLNKSVNTIVWDPDLKAWQGHSTDGEGLKAILTDLSDKKIAVWGGGGVKPAIQRLLPNAIYFSARKGTPDKDQDVSGWNPDVIVWAVGRARFIQGGKMPPNHWQPQQVIDLNYTADSPGLEYAQTKKVSYTSGLKMFKKQAESQRQFWRGFD